MEDIEIKKEKKKEYIRLWKKSHPERLKYYARNTKAWKSKNKEKIATYAKKYRESHPDVIRRSKKLYRERHRERLGRERKLYREKNKVIRVPRVLLTKEEIKFNKKYKYAYTKYKRNARIRQYDFLLSFEDFCKLLDTPCYYCGGIGGGVDRVDNSIGYVLDNVVACCRPCNWTKRVLSKQAFINICIAVAKKHGTSPALA